MSTIPEPNADHQIKLPTSLYDELGSPSPSSVGKTGSTLPSAEEIFSGYIERTANPAPQQDRAA
ncbi:MAG: hypothetical protein V1746_07710 [bacterium]